MEFDHAFILCAVGAPEGNVLVSAGLREGSSNRHPGRGDGTNRRFFFANAFLELVWVADSIEVQSKMVLPTQLVGALVANFALLTAAI